MNKGITIEVESEKIVILQLTVLQKDKILDSLPVAQIIGEAIRV